MPATTHNISEKAALRGEPSYVWRAGQARRLNMILSAAGSLASGRVLVDGCGVGTYLARLTTGSKLTVGLDIELERAVEAHQKAPAVTCGDGEKLPFADNLFDLVLSHEVIEHVGDDRAALHEIFRVLRPGGRLMLFCPNRGYPFETHGIYWHGSYHFGNIPLVNYLPRSLRDRLAPHVKVYGARDLKNLLSGLPARVVSRQILFGAYDNVIERWPGFGKTLRKILQSLEKTPFKTFGLSHFWVVEKAV
ncbi:MAG: methyltransferase domain-containing protein [Anaerolineaceae bacterium]